ncbi:MAG: hypothetical protein V5A88_00630 [Candidatus Thermoplasmatota archaeon]
MKISPLVSRPHHIHFYQNLIKELKKKGHEILLLHTGNELTRELLEPLNIRNRSYGRSFDPEVTKIVSSLYNKISLLRELKSFDPDLLLSVNGLPPSPFNSLLGVPTVVFLDTEPNPHDEYFLFNYASKVITPDCYHASVPGEKHFDYSSYHALAYLHPNWFTPDTRVLDELDLEPRDYVIASFGKHIEKKIDLKRHPLRRRQIIDLVRNLEDHCRVFVDERSYVPSPLKDHCPSIHPTKYLDLLANAEVVIGDNPVVSAEAGALGTPWIYISNYTTFTLEDQELHYEVGSQVPTVEEGEELAEMILTGELELDYDKPRKKILKDKTDLTKWMVALVRSLGNLVRK